MRGVYIDIMEKSLSAYDIKRIRDYIDEVRANGLKEHGFARLTANIGILIAHGRRTELLPVFTEMMDICCERMPKVKAANDFTIREICCLLMLIRDKGIVPDAVFERWRQEISGFDPWKYYTCIAESPHKPVGNWAAFSGVSEFIRGICCNIDTSEFVDWQISSQLLSFDSCGMYKDPHNPMVYDLVTRGLLGTLLRYGYSGKLREEIENQLDKSADITLKMQSVTGEIPFGGRSNQFLHNELMLAAVCEYYAVRFMEKGDPEKAGLFKGEAELAKKAALRWLDDKPIRHIKNKYGRDSGIGCEGYGYFNKYMITVASNAFEAYLLADDSIVPSTAPGLSGGYIAETSEDFHKLFLNCGGYFLELDTNADFHYDANGLGRIHKAGCPSALCLSVPFPAGEDVKYRTEKENIRPMSLCCYAVKDGKTYYSSEKGTKYALTDKYESQDRVEAEIKCELSPNIEVLQKYCVSQDGVTITLKGCENTGLMLPVFYSDGMNTTHLDLGCNYIRVSYNGGVCTYYFSGKVAEKADSYYNRNGVYKVYKVNTKSVKIVLN